MSDPLDVLKASLADRYAVEREIGSGGMATVYLAQDLKHNRPVALKVLDPDLAATVGADRFLREIETAANLTHPHILPLHDSGEADGLVFYVMPYVEGESLRAWLDREGQLPIDDALRIAREIADALAYAHERGVIHRDVKPANIMLEAGHAVLADFGVAQAVAGVDETRLTATGVSLGTPSYMSPEQAAGERELDGRSDQYALGCVLYEMLAGEPPFTGQRAESVVRQHLVSEPRSITEVRSTVPAEVEAALVRVLAKAPADRFGTTAELGKVLEGQPRTPPGGTPSTPARARRWLGWATGAITLFAILIAGYVVLLRGEASDLVESRVLVNVFENQTGDPELEPVGHMVADLIIRELWQLGIGVVQVLPLDASRAVLQRVRSQNEWTAEGGPICAAASQMGVGLTISGSFYLTADSLALEARMIDVSTCRVRRSFLPATAPLEQPGHELATFARRVAATVGLHLDPMWRPFASESSEPSSVSVYRDVMAAREAFINGDYALAQELRLRALEADSTSVDALFGIADHYLNRTGEYRKGDSVLAILERNRDRLSPMYQGWVDVNRAWIDGDRQRAYRTVRRLAEEIPAAQHLYAWGWEAVGINRPREAADVFRSFDPQRPDLLMRSAYWTLLADALHMLGEYEEELKQVLLGQQQYPEASALVYAEGRALAAAGRVEEALERAEEIELRWGDSGRRRRLAAALHSYGHADAARILLQNLLSEYEELTPEERAQRTQRAGLAETLYLLDRFEEARDVYRQASLELSPEDPEYLDNLGSLGVLAARLGEEEEARRIFDQLEGIERLRLNGRNHRWQAYIAAHLGGSDLAVRLLGLAHSKGLRFGPWLYIDVDLEPLRSHPAFAEFQRPKG